MMRGRVSTRGLSALALGLLLLAAGVTAHEGEKHDAAAHEEQAEKAESGTRSAEVDLRNRMLVDQDGREVKFVTDVIGDRIVVMDFVYTTCTTVCPVISAVFTQVQERMGDDLGKDLALVSLSVDAVRDTPRRMKAMAAKYDARPGWIWLTGPKLNVDDVLTGLGAFSVNFEDHPAMVIVGDGRTGQWSRFFGFPSPDRIMEQVNVLQAAREAQAAGG